MGKKAVATSKFNNLPLIVTTGIPSIFISRPATATTNKPTRHKWPAGQPSNNSHNQSVNLSFVGCWTHRQVTRKLSVYSVDNIFRKSVHVEFIVLLLFQMSGFWASHSRELIVEGLSVNFIRFRDNRAQLPKIQLPSGL